MVVTPYYPPRSRRQVFKTGAVGGEMQVTDAYRCVDAGNLHRYRDLYGFPNVVGEDHPSTTAVMVSCLNAEKVVNAPQKPAVLM